MPKLTNPTRLVANTSAVYPDLSEKNPAMKDAAYIAQYGQAHVSDYQTNGRMDWYGNNEASDRLAYAQGRQDPAKYRRLRRDNEKLDKVGSRLDLRILKVVPKYVKTISGLLDQAEYVASADAVDGLAEDMKAAYEGALRAQMENGDKLGEVGVNMSPDGQPAPLDEDEIMLRMLQYKNAEALRLEASVQKSMYDTNMPQVMRKCNMYNAIFGRSCIYHYRTKGHVLPQSIEPWRLFLLPSLDEDYKDLKAGAHLEEITIGQLRSEAGDEFTDSEYRDLAASKSVQSRGGRSWSDIVATDGIGNYLNSMTVQIIRFGFMSWNEDEKGKYWAWYEGTLVVETQLAYGCRQAYNQLYDMENPGAVLAPYIPIIPDQIAGWSMSVVDEVMSPADFVQRNWIKLQDELNRSVSKGFAYDLDRIEDVVLSEKKKLTKDEVIEMFERTGRWVHTGVTADGTKDGNIGLRELPNGISTDVITLFQLIQNGIDLIERMTGVNSAVSAGNAEKRVAVGALDAAKAGAANALQFLFAAQSSLFERSARAVASHHRQQEILERGVDEGYGAHVFRLLIEQLPTAEEKEKFQTTLNEALAAGAIDFLDVNIIQQVKNPRLGRILLAARAKRKQADMAKMKQEDAANASKLQAQAAADKLKELQTLKQMEYDARLNEIKVKEAAETKRLTLLANIKAAADKDIEYYRAIASMHNTALSGSWQAAIGSIPKPTGTEGGATASATRAATLEALSGAVPEMAMLPPAPPAVEPEPDPNEAALQELMGGAPPQGEPEEAAPAPAMMPA